MGKVWERPGRGHGSELFVFMVFPWFFAVWPKTSRTQKKSSDPWARSGLSTHKPKNKKTKKTKKQETKKPKKQKKQDCTPQGEGVRCRVLGLVFLFFLFFLVFWFFGFLIFCFFVFLGFCFFGLCVDSHCRCAKQRLPGTVSGCTRGRAGKNQKTKKPKNQKKQKPKNQKTKKNKKNKIAHPKGRGSDAECWVLSFCFFGFVWVCLVFCFFVFLFFWFFSFLFFWFVCG